MRADALLIGRGCWPQASEAYFAALPCWCTRGWTTHVHTTRMGPLAHGWCTARRANCQAGWSAQPQCRPDVWLLSESGARKSNLPGQGRRKSIMG